MHVNRPLVFVTLLLSVMLRVIHCKRREDFFLLIAVGEKIGSVCYQIRIAFTEEGAESNLRPAHSLHAFHSA